MRPWPPSLPREAGGAGEGRARAGGEYLLVRRLPSSRLLPSFLPGRETPGGARLLQCVYERESTRTPLCHYRRTQLLFTEKSVRTRPPRGDRRDDCVPAHGNTPHSCARGWTFKTCPLTPPRAALVARSGSPGDAEPCCYPLLRKRFSGTRYVALGLVPVYLRWVQRGVCVCARPALGSSSSRSPVILPSPRHQGSRAYPGLTRPQGHKRMLIAYLGPQLPEHGPGAAVRSPQCAWRLGKAGDPWQRRRLFPLAPGAPSVLEAGTLPSQAPPSPPSHTPPR